MARLKTKQELIDDINAMGGDLFPEEYKNSVTAVTWVCKNDPNHVFLRTPKVVLRTKARCAKCKGTYQESWDYIKLVDKLESMGAFLYLKLLSRPNNISDKATWQCLKDPSHIWETTVSKVIDQKTKCPKCVSNSKKSKEYFIKWLNTNLPNEVKVLTLPKNTETPFKLSCNVCDTTWEQSFRNIKKAKKKLCPTCFRLMRTTEEFIFEVQQLGIEYIPLGEYKGYTEELEWKCPENHVWKATPNCVVYNRTRCPICTADKSILYILKFNKLPGSFKVGITKDLISLNNRIKSINIPETTVVLATNVYNPRELESYIMQELSKYRYFENYARNGNTEFYKGLHVEDIFECILKYLTTN